MSSSHVIVVGTGVLGLTLAHTLLRRGLAVTVVGPRTGDHPGQATRAAGAMLSTFSEIEPGHTEERTAIELAEQLSAHQLWPQLAETLSRPGAPLTLTAGTWILAPPGQEAGRAPIAAARASAHPVEEHPSTAIPGLPDDVRPSAALWLPSEASVDSAVLLDALSFAVAAHPRARWSDTLAATAAPGEVTLRDGSVLAASCVVLAAATAIPALLPERGRPFGVAPILAGRGVSAILRTTASTLPHVVRTPNDRFACGVHLVPRADGTVYLGGTNRLTLVLARTASAGIWPTFRDGYRSVTASSRAIICRVR